MKLVKKKYEHYLNIDIPIDLERTLNINLYIVYFINCMLNVNYMEWIINHMNLVKNYEGEIYLIAVIKKEDEKSFRDSINLLNPKINIECFFENEHEYRGILKVWDLGQKHNSDNDIILYFHSKNITRYSHYIHTNLNSVIDQYDRAKEIFTIFPTIDKVGNSCGGSGWIWMNFWYVRASCLKTIERPVKTSRRHYYEDWLGRKVEVGDEICEYERSYDKSYPYINTLESCYQFFTNKKDIANIGSYFSSETGRYHKDLTESTYNYKKFYSTI